MKISSPTISEERQLFLRSRIGLLEKWYPIHRDYEDGVEVSRWKSALRSSEPRAEVLDQIQAAGWEVWQEIRIHKANHGYSVLSVGSYAGLSLALGKNRPVEVELTGKPPYGGLQKAKVVLERNEFSLLHGHKGQTPIRLAFSATTAQAQMLIQKGG